MIDSSQFNEIGFTSGGLGGPGFRVYLSVNATDHLGTSRLIEFTTYPVTGDFFLVK